MLSLMMLVFVVIVRVFSESPEPLVGIDTVVILGIVALSGGLFLLLGRMARR
jgi:hypothetical protein